MLCEIPNTTTPNLLPIRPGGGVVAPGPSVTATREFVLSWVRKLNTRIDELALGSLGVATRDQLGAVIIGDGLDITETGKISVVPPDLSGYLTLNSASATYATLSSLANYLTKSNAESTYAKLEKLTEYLTKSDAASTYAKVSALADYLTKSDATSTYATASDMATALSLKVPLVKDNAGGYTSVVVGSLDTEDNPSVGKNVVAVGSGNKASGNYALVVGTDNTLRGNDAVCFGRQSSAGSSAFAIGVSASAGAEGFAFGYNVKAGGSSYPYSMALGRDANASAPNIFVWNGVELPSTRYAGSRSKGTFNVNPEGGVEGFYVGDKNLKTIISEEAPSTTFHQLVLETTDDKVTLKPEDGKANWVEGVVDLKERITRFLSANFTLEVYYESPLPDEGAPLYARYTCRFALEDGDFELLTDLDSLSFDFTGGGVWESFESIYIKLNKEIDITSTWEGDIPANAVIDVFPTRLTAGTVIDLRYLLFFYDNEEGYPPLKENNIELSGNESDYLGGMSPESFYYNGTELYYEGYGGVFLFKQTVEKKRPSLTISLPDEDSHITAKRLSIALTSGGTSVSEVAWHGADKVIEAFPGASKLIPGEVVWDVKEVSPGKMLINRAPGAAGGAVTITGDNGTTYTLAIDSEGTLEVRA